MTQINVSETRFTPQTPPASWPSGSGNCETDRRRSMTALKKSAFGMVPFCGPWDGSLMNFSKGRILLRCGFVVDILIY